VEKKIKKKIAEPKVSKCQSRLFIMEQQIIACMNADVYNLETYGLLVRVVIF
jgi:hypothetical protein